MAHNNNNNLPCDSDGNCMLCKTTPGEEETLTCNTCATPWHVPCLFAPPNSLADAATWDCPDCSVAEYSHAPPLSAAGRSDLAAAVSAINSTPSLSEKDKARRRQELLSGTNKETDDDDDDDNGGVFRLLEENLTCSCCMQLLERPVTTPCGHNFCLKCFQKWVRQGKHSCANCRCSIPSNMASNPHINSALAVAITLAKMSKSNSSEGLQKVMHAKKFAKENSSSEKILFTIPPDDFGPISACDDPVRKQGVLVGQTWDDWTGCTQSGVHLSDFIGISGQTDYGVQYVALSAEDEDTEDHGDWFLYMKRYLSSNKRMKKKRLLDQKFEQQNNVLRVTCQKGYPLRVVRDATAKMHQVEVCGQACISNVMFARHADLCSQNAEYEELDQVMVRLRPEHCSNGKYEKMKTHTIGPYKIIHKINSKIYVLDLPKNMGISKIFKSEDLSLYQGSSNNTSADCLPLTSIVCDEIEDIVDTKVVSTRRAGYQKYLVKWKNKQWSDCTWICDDDFQRVDFDLYGKYHSFASLKPNSFEQSQDESDVSGRVGKYYTRKCNPESQAKIKLSDRFKIEKLPSYAPKMGIRYDGIYRIEKCWLQVCKGYKSWRYLFVRCDNEPAPWTSDDHGDRPKPLPDFKELKNATVITERKESPSWYYDVEKDTWMWKNTPPVARKSTEYLDGKRKFGDYTEALSVREMLLKELSCLICHKTVVFPLTTPCAHNFCKSCLEGVFSGQGLYRQRKFDGWRTLRAQKNHMRCPSCSNDIFDFLQNPQVNTGLMNVVNLFQWESIMVGRNVELNEEMDADGGK